MILGERLFKILFIDYLPFGSSLTISDLNYVEDPDL